MQSLKQCHVEEVKVQGYHSCHSQLRLHSSELISSQRPLRNVQLPFLITSTWTLPTLLSVGESPRSDSTSGVCGTAASPLASAAGQAADDNVEESNDAIDDGHADGADAVDNGHDDISDGLADAL
jgi:hypothetical protein